METTFSARRFELFETTSPSKNGLLINGVGIALDSTVKTRCTRSGDVSAVRIDGTEAMGLTRENKQVVSFAGRLFLMISSKAFLILDRVELPATGRLESRLHTRGQVELQDRSAIVRGNRQQMRLAYAASVPAYLTAADAAMTVPSPEGNPKVVRWCTKTRTHRQITMATLLVPGTTEAQVELIDEGDTVVATMAAGEWRRTIRVSNDLQVVAAAS
jgi:hypothetical protein